MQPARTRTRPRRWRARDRAHDRGLRVGVGARRVGGRVVGLLRLRLPVSARLSGRLVADDRRLPPGLRRAPRRQSEPRVQTDRREHAVLRRAVDGRRAAALRRRRPPQLWADARRWPPPRRRRESGAERGDGGARAASCSACSSTTGTRGSARRTASPSARSTRCSRSSSSRAQKYNYDGHLYFDTFPRNEDPVRECEYNIRRCEALWAAAERLRAGRSTR